MRILTPNSPEVQALLNALGLGDYHIQKLELVLTPTKPVQLNLEILLDDDRMERVTRVFEVMDFKLIDPDA